MPLLRLLCLVLLCAGTTARAEQDLKTLQLISAERRALDSVNEMHLGKLMGLTPQVPDQMFSRAWIDAQPRARGGPEWYCLTEALYFEARGETVRGQFAVAEVILNRVESSRFPSTVCRVVNQGTGRRFACQFTYTCDGLPEHVAEPAAWNRVGKVAAAMLAGAPRDQTNGATFYHTTAVNPYWASVFRRTAHIGVHLFYRETSLASRS